VGVLDRFANVSVLHRKILPSIIIINHHHHHPLSSSSSIHVSTIYDYLSSVDYKLNPDRLYATYFGGDAAQGLEVDVEGDDDRHDEDEEEDYDDDDDDVLQLDTCCPVMVIVIIDILLTVSS
jgi:hypothetical protein